MVGILGVVAVIEDRVFAVAGGLVSMSFFPLPLPPKVDPNIFHPLIPPPLCPPPSPYVPSNSHHTDRPYASSNPPSPYSLSPHPIHKSPLGPLIDKRSFLLPLSPPPIYLFPPSQHPSNRQCQTFLLSSTLKRFFWCVASRVASLSATG